MVYIWCHWYAPRSHPRIIHPPEAMNSFLAVAEAAGSEQCQCQWHRMTQYVAWQTKQIWILRGHMVVIWTTMVKWSTCFTIAPQDSSSNKSPVCGFSHSIKILGNLLNYFREDMNIPQTHNHLWLGMASNDYWAFLPVKIIGLFPAQKECYFCRIKICRTINRICPLWAIINHT